MSKNNSIALFDIDKTIYNDHSFFGVTKYFVDERIMPQKLWDDVNVEAKKYSNKEQNYSTTARNLLEIYAVALAGMNYADILDATKKFFKINSEKFYPYFNEILPVLKKRFDVFLVSTNSQMIAEVVKDIYDLDGYLSTEFEVEKGYFTGKILRSLADGKQIVRDLVLKYDDDSLAVGDSENDISMLEQVKIPVCINPSEKLLMEAKKRNWLVIGDKDATNEFEKILNDQ